MDMSKDPKMYSFSKEDYKIVLSYNPRTTSPHLTDRFGWSGEGMTDSNASHVFYDSRNTVAKHGAYRQARAHRPHLGWRYGSLDRAHQPVRMIKVVYKVKRSQIMGETADNR